MREHLVFYTIYDGPFNINRAELEDGRFWMLAELDVSFHKNIFTPNFEHDYPTVRKLIT